MTEVVAYDIDGALTEEDIMLDFTTNSVREDVTVGVITSRSEEGMDRFLNRHDLRPDFAKSSRLKGVTMRRLKRDIDAESYEYVGSNLKDAAQARVGGWESRTV